MRGLLAVVMLVGLVSGCEGETARTSTPVEPFQAVTLEVLPAEGEVWQVQVTDRVAIDDGLRYSLVVRGQRYALDVERNDDATIHTLERGDALVALAETASDGTSTLMNAVGETVMSTPNVDPLGDAELAAMFPAETRVLLGSDFLSQLASHSGDGLGSVRAPLRNAESCANKCSSGSGATCCCGEGYGCEADLKKCKCVRDAAGGTAGGAIGGYSGLDGAALAR